MKMKTKSFIGFLFCLIILVLSYSVFAAPLGPQQILQATPQRRSSGLDTSGGTSIQGQAGNLTSVNISSLALTKRWQGYFGNVTGTITLDDTNGNTIYNWQLLNPQGEVYVANGSASGAVTWTNVFCFNYTNNKTNGPVVQRFNGTDLERTIGSNIYDRDSVNSTFNDTFTGTFTVGSTTITATSGCRQTTLFVSDAYQQTDFVEVLLTDNDSIIYTALLESDTTGFESAPVDFEAIVGENGDTVAATTYYFFVELA